MGQAPGGGQWIRSPREVLVAPRNGTCLDLALVLAAGCKVAGLPTVVVLMDAVTPGGPGHALVAVLLGKSWPGGVPEDEVWTHLPDDFVSAVRADWDGPPREVVVLDPNGIAHSLGTSAMTGTDVDLASAVAAGHRQLTGEHQIGRAHV